jgi:hypothetical protein
MLILTNKQTGTLGEKEIVKRVKCPNCLSTLVLLPEGFPMYDIQCSRCLFRAQIKTVKSKPKSSIFGAGWDIYGKVMKAGYLAPQLIVNFKWKAKNGGLNQEIRFYPFIAKGNIQKYQLSAKARRANYRMFKYVGLESAPFIVMHSKHDPSRSV